MGQGKPSLGTASPNTLEVILFPDLPALESYLQSIERPVRRKGPAQWRSRCGRRHHLKGKDTQMMGDVPGGVAARHDCTAYASSEQERMHDLAQARTDRCTSSRIVFPT